MMSLKIRKISMKIIITVLFACQMTIPFFFGAQWSEAVNEHMQHTAIAGALAHATLLCGLMFMVTADLKE
ncbi:TMhelix containing protein [Vibrio phage 1.253.O._10N.286.45.B12]|nr:TMhelix containing protein [Vibrio phage 1.235.O._10N.261.52.B2]AUR98576.1 TMhelix containing protein [Vibrio phage 1.253.O._10N.286.45.B12]